MGIRKYDESMSHNDLIRNSMLIGFYFSDSDRAGKKRDYSGLKMVGSWSDATFFTDKDGNIWEEYVPTFD